MAENARVCWVPKFPANDAEAASFDLFVVWLSHSGVDLHGVVIAVFVTMCAEVAP